MLRLVSGVRVGELRLAVMNFPRVASFTEASNDPVAVRFSFSVWVMKLLCNCLKSRAYN